MSTINSSDIGLSTETFNQCSTKAKLVFPEYLDQSGMASLANLSSGDMQSKTPAQQITSPALVQQQSICQEKMKNSSLMSVICEQSHHSSVQPDNNSSQASSVCHSGGDSQNNLLHYQQQIKQQQGGQQQQFLEHTLVAISQPNHEEHENLVHIDGQFLQVINLQSTDGTPEDHSHIQTLTRTVEQQIAGQEVETTNKKTGFMAQLHSGALRHTNSPNIETIAVPGDHQTLSSGHIQNSQNRQTSLPHDGQNFHSQNFINGNSQAQNFQRHENRQISNQQFQNALVGNITNPEAQRTIYEQPTFYPYNSVNGTGHSFYNSNQAFENERPYSITSHATVRQPAYVHNHSGVTQNFQPQQQVATSSVASNTNAPGQTYSHQVTAPRSVRPQLPLSESGSLNSPFNPNAQSGALMNTNNNKSESIVPVPNVEADITTSTSSADEKNRKDMETSQQETKASSPSNIQSVSAEPHECLISPLLKELNNNMNSFRQTFFKPDINIVQQVVEAFIHSGKKEMHPYQVYEELEKLFPFYAHLDQKKKKSWMSSVRHALTTSRFKSRVIEETNMKTCIRKGCLWSLNDKYNPDTPMRVRRTSRPPEKGSSRRKQKLVGRTRKDFPELENNNFCSPRFFQRPAIMHPLDAPTAHMQSSFAPGALVFPSSYPMMNYVQPQQLYPTPMGNQWLAFSQAQQGMQRFGPMNTNCNNMNVMAPQPVRTTQANNFESRQQQTGYQENSNQGFIGQMNGTVPPAPNQELRNMVYQSMNMNDQAGKQHPTQMQAVAQNPMNMQNQPPPNVYLQPVQQMSSIMSQPMTHPPVYQATFTSSGLVKEKDLFTKGNQVKVEDQQTVMKQPRD